MSVNFGAIGLVAIAVTASMVLPCCAQIPTVCTDTQSLENSICCPTTTEGVCGMNANRGSCGQLSIPNYNATSSDVRVNWPHYFTQACVCNGNYAGYDCSRCKFGYFGTDCNQKQILPRRPISDYSAGEWTTYNNILRKTRTYDSGYIAVLEEQTPGNVNLSTSNTSLYHLYVWIHHYTAKDSRILPERLDYSHNGPAFFTWHRLMNLWFEWEIQWMLKSMGEQDYHTFRLPYWDWRTEIQTSSGISSELLFTEDKLGATRNVSGSPQVFGTLYDGGWDTICWFQLGTICDPTVSTGRLQRCPFTGTDPCSSSNPDWPKLEDVNNAMKFNTFDVAPYNDFSPDGFRNFVDFEVGLSVDECRNNRMCQCVPGGANCEVTNGIPPGISLTVQMHTMAHIIPGTGDVTTNLTDNMKGTIEDVAASPNDPLFIVHHTMIDCILDEWLKRYPDATYPTSPLVRDGHRPGDYVRSFFPLYTNIELFKRTEEFGYSCSISNITVSSSLAMTPPTLVKYALIFLGVTLCQLM